MAPQATNSEVDFDELSTQPCPQRGCDAGKIPLQTASSIASDGPLPIATKETHPCQVCCTLRTESRISTCDIAMLPNGCADASTHSKAASKSEDESEPYPWHLFFIADAHAPKQKSLYEPHGYDYEATAKASICGAAPFAAAAGQAAARAACADCRGYGRHDPCYSVDRQKRPMQAFKEAEAYLGCLASDCECATAAWIDAQVDEETTQPRAVALDSQNIEEYRNSLPIRFESATKLGALSSDQLSAGQRQRAAAKLFRYSSPAQVDESGEAQHLDAEPCSCSSCA
ncbi:hypothetical protein FQA39_LY19074 [Lamprigera yunnana]|nr:hypothetical protein FQA39_LY19074 [Lamprigera yunnana]